MPEKRTLARARKDKRQGKAASTQAGEFVREEIDHVREGKHGARSAKQAIAIGLSKARRAGVEIPDKRGGKVSTATKRTGRVSSKRSRATTKALKDEPHRTVSRRALSRQGKAGARERSHAERSRAAKQAARTRKREQR